MRAKLMLVDGSSLAHRAFHALPPLSSRTGVATNAVYGFINMLEKAIATIKPDYILVAFDKGRVTFRHQTYGEYKAQRKESPEELRSQFPLIKKILEAMQVAILEADNYEADDIIGTLAQKAAKENFETIIVTGDRDAFQLISPQTKVMITRKGISQIELFDLSHLQQELKIKPAQVPDLKGLMGDASDNIPGVPGIGEKTALKLLADFQTVEDILAHRKQIKDKKLASLLDTYAEQAKLSKQLATISCTVPLPEGFSWENCLFRTPDYQSLLAIFQELDFQSLIPAVLEKMKESNSKEETKEKKKGVLLLQNLPEVEAYLEKAFEREGLFFAPIFGPRGEIKGAGLALSATESCAVSFSPPYAQESFFSSPESTCTASWEEFITFLKSFLKTKKPKNYFYFHDAKPGVLAFLKAGLEEIPLGGDTLIAAYLLEPTASSYTLSQLSLDHLNTPYLAQEDEIVRAAEEAKLIFKLYPLLKQKLKIAEMEELYERVELPLVSVLARMEQAGIKVDKEELVKIGKELDAGIQRLTQEIYALAGEEFNLNSPKQLGCILFEKLKLPVVKKTKTGFSTSVEVLEELAPQHEIVALIMEYRQLAKLKNTYIDGLIPLINPRTGKLHTSFNQTVTATGRLSSAEPNLQNIPVRLELGRKIRRAFLPSSPQNLILAADYSQIELRVLAHLSGDEALLRAFQQQEDIHTATAAEVFGCSPGEVTPEIRRRAKAVNFGIVYGISDYGLAQSLGIPREEAREYIARYFQRYPGVKRYLEETIARARETGYVTTILKRRRSLPELFSPNRNLRQFGERTAMNTPVQGSAADLIKLGMVAVDQELRQRKLAAKMILQVHDELIFDVPQPEVPEVALIAKNCLENAYPLRVPLKVEIKIGPDWYNLRPYFLN